METRVADLDGRTIAETAIQDFKTALRGSLLRPGTDGYEDARKIWNANIEKHPALIAKCTGVADIVHSVNFARDNEVLVSIKGGGHSIPGLGLCDGGLAIDLSSLKGVRVDPVEKTARAGTGVTWGEYDHETQSYGLASTGGEISTTGISGLTLGGGNGWLNGMFGTSCDNLIGADVVTADGTSHSVNQDQEKDLFWGLRGGGGNFGVVSSLKYKIHPVGKVIGGFVGWHLDMTKEVMEFLEGFVRDLPDEVGKIGVEVIASREGVPMVIIRPGYFGSVEEGQKLLAPIQKLGQPRYDNLRPMSYEALQSSRDPYWPWGRHNYFKSGFVKALTDDVIETYVAHTRNVPSQYSQIAVEYYHGAYSRVKSDETAYPHRLTGWNLAIGGSWLDASESEKNINWVRAFWDDIEPFTSGGVYVNFMSAGEDDRVKVAYGGNYDRLVSVKNRYDPTNLFKVNENIKPSASSKK
ncbi:MAG TPA: FAD-binding oxidoreductase [Nitrososphaerales archaeon]|nr:FAD-binding oxidoreductase [Nitrososphaerales archaeon]